jgi:hypothetical protein
MCVVSMIADHYQEKWHDWKEYIITPTAEPWKNPSTTTLNLTWGPTKEEFDALKKEVEDMKALLKKAKIYDEVNNEPDCEMEQKIDFIKQIAKFVGIDVDELFKKKE